MTRLLESHIQETLAFLADIDEMLMARVRNGLRGVALHAIGVAENEPPPVPVERVTVVPITAGEGIIPGFAEAVSAIARHLGFDAEVASGADVSGIAEAYVNGGDIMLLADEFRFVAVNLRTGAVADNDRATGEGFAALLEMMAGGLRGRPCGVIGCGPVGTAAAMRLARHGAKLTVCDLDETRGRGLATRIQAEIAGAVSWVDNVADLMKVSRYIVDAAPAGGIIAADAVRPDMFITAPGVPLGLTSDAMELMGSRIYHDNLPLGVATMLMAAAHGRMIVEGMPRGA
ncbi:MAG: 3-methylornithyl-N6-L-lysine dehydrogenase PylD [Desulfobacterales bacterium]